MRCRRSFLAEVLYLPRRWRYGSRNFRGGRESMHAFASLACSQEWSGTGEVSSQLHGIDNGTLRGLNIWFLSLSLCSMVDDGKCFR